MGCWACELARGERRQHKTKWLFLSPNVGAVVVDLHSKGFDKRVLFVPELHIKCGQETEADRRTAEDLLIAVVKARFPEHKIMRFDWDCSYRAHWHVQACLMKR